MICKSVVPRFGEFLVYVNVVATWHEVIHVWALGLYFGKHMETSTVFCIKLRSYDINWMILDPLEGETLAL